MTADPRIGEVIAWWQDAAENWFSQSPVFDAAFRTRFGRFPQRQPIIKRALTPEDSQYLNAGGFQR